MDEKIRIIIADDNVGFCDILSKYLKKYENIEIIGIAHTDEEEISLIETLHPDIVITDLVRNYKYTGLEIIKDYSKKDVKPEFLVISADRKEDVINGDLQVGGYIKKPFSDYSIIIEELTKIKADITIKQNQLMIQEQKKMTKLNFIQKFLDLFKVRK